MVVSPPTDASPAAAGAFESGNVNPAYRRLLRPLDSGYSRPIHFVPLPFESPGESRLTTWLCTAASDEVRDVAARLNLALRAERHEPAPEQIWRRLGPMARLGFVPASAANIDHSIAWNGCNLLALLIAEPPSNPVGFCAFAYAWSAEPQLRAKGGLVLTAYLERAWIAIDHRRPLGVDALAAAVADGLWAGLKVMDEQCPWHVGQIAAVRAKLYGLRCAGASPLFVERCWNALMGAVVRGADHLLHLDVASVQYTQAY